MTNKRKLLALVMTVLVLGLFFTSCGKKKEKIKVIEISSNHQIQTL